MAQVAPAPCMDVCSDSGAGPAGAGAAAVRLATLPHPPASSASPSAAAVTRAPRAAGAALLGLPAACLPLTRLRSV